MADMESICARLCLLTRAAWRSNLPAPLTREIVGEMIRLGALEGLTLRVVPGIKDEVYERAQALLTRSARIYDEVKRFRTEGYFVILPQDHDWPSNLDSLGRIMPQFLFARGNKALLKRRAVAVAGRRTAEAGTLRIAQSIGIQLASEDYALVCGGAQGVDTAAQYACLKNGGSLILVPAYPCCELLRQEYLQRALDEDRVLILCETWPDEPFSASKALARNHTIYALGSAGIVVAARSGIGDSWRGAADCLAGGYTPVFAVNEHGSDFDGNRALLDLGAKAIAALKPIKPQIFGKEV